MRITNKMMSNNSQTNINNNKQYLDKLNNELASGKKITRPSDDPITAIRALKLRSNLTEITQYYDRNTNDANAWLKSTQDAIESTKSILTSMKAEFTEGATGTNTVESRNAILKELQSLRNQIYDDGNADYAGRTLFTGYRTSSKLTFQESDDLNTAYSITETFSSKDLSSVTYVSGKLSKAQTTDPVANTSVEQDIDSKTYSRIRLSYDNMDSSVPMTSFNIYDKDKNITDTFTVTTIDDSDPNYPDSAYDIASAGTDAIFNSVTGELILSDSAATTIKNMADDSYVEASYSKNSWSAGDLRPEHYFACSSVDSNGKTINYDNDKEHVISYDISSNQNMQINTHASEVFFHGIGRDIDEMISAINFVNDAAGKVSDLEKKLELNPDDSDVKNAYDAAKKEYSLLSDKMQRMFEHGQTTFDTYIKDVTLAGTEVGTRIQRLDLVQNRLLELKTTAKELADANENVELPEVAIDVSEAELSYNAALMATGKISQQSLLSYI